MCYVLLSSLNHGGFYENRCIYKARRPGKYAELNAALRCTVSTWGCWCVLGDSVTPGQPSVMEGKGALSLSRAVLPSSLIPVAINTIPPSFSCFRAGSLWHGVESRCCLLSVPDIVVSLSAAQFAAFNSCFYHLHHLEQSRCIKCSEVPGCPRLFMSQPFSRHYFRAPLVPFLHCHQLCVIPT